MGKVPVLRAKRRGREKGTVAGRVENRAEKKKKMDGQRRCTRSGSDQVRVSIRLKDEPRSLAQRKVRLPRQRQVPQITFADYSNGE